MRFTLAIVAFVAFTVAVTALPMEQEADLAGATPTSSSNSSPTNPKKKVSVSPITEEEMDEVAGRNNNNKQLAPETEEHAPMQRREALTWRQPFMHPNDSENG
ncbi:hypothetical protein IWQ60_012555, partial [Tieghemiomyces parasiticus]